MEFPTEQVGARTLEKPEPRHPKTAAKLAQLQAQNRRREYLERNPSYFQNLDHELADPVLYERLIKKFHTEEERLAEGRSKGYVRTLESDLARGEMKLSKLTAQTATDNAAAAATTTTHQQQPTQVLPSRDIEQAWDTTPENKEHGAELWREFLSERFIRGLDEDFDYDVVDNSDEYDGVARREAEAEWFDDEEPSWADEGESAEEGEAPRRARHGEMGIQDF